MSNAPAYQVTLMPSGQRFEARADETLLKAGLRAMAPMHSSCRAPAICSSSRTAWTGTSPTWRSRWDAGVCAFV